MRFTALEDFWSDDLKSQYVQDMTYTVRPPDKKLADLVPTWAMEAKVKIVEDKPGMTAKPSQISGSGTVT